PSVDRDINNNNKNYKLLKMPPHDRGSKMPPTNSFSVPAHHGSSRPKDDRPCHHGFKNYGSILLHFVLRQTIFLTYQLLNLKGQGNRKRSRLMHGQEVEVALKDVCYHVIDAIASSPLQ
ncbi:hypothetical protein PENTCL1PPCAC_13556, partial [Pristionchus entomophagus]